MICQATSSTIYHLSILSCWKSLQGVSWLDCYLWVHEKSDFDRAISSRSDTAWSIDWCVSVPLKRCWNLMSCWNRGIMDQSQFSGTRFYIPVHIRWRQRRAVERQTFEGNRRGLIDNDIEMIHDAGDDHNHNEGVETSKRITDIGEIRTHAFNEQWISNPSP